MIFISACAMIMHMRFLIQVVTKAEVTVLPDEAACDTAGNAAVQHQPLHRGSIGRGLMVLVGIGQGDDRALADRMIDKMLKLRIFSDEAGKTNLSLADVGGALMLVSQFTLYADCRRGNRPGFTYAGKPDEANELYEYIVARCKEQVPQVERGMFGAYMQVTLTNDGPFTIMLDSEELNRPRNS